MHRIRRLRDARQVLLMQQLEQAAVQAALNDALATEVARRAAAEAAESAVNETIQTWRDYIQAADPDPTCIHCFAVDFAARDANHQQARRLEKEAEQASDERRHAFGRCDVKVVTATRTAKSLAKQVQHARAEKAYAALEDRLSHDWTAK